ncbi:MAG: type II toxin-antitoxin system Phd/YefM family antitoxin [Ectothiorhodospira sp.]
MTMPSDHGGAMNLEYVTKSQFKAKALEYFRQVETSGESVVITDHGRPSVEVRRYRSDPRSPMEKLRGSVVDYISPTGSVAEDDWAVVP